MGEAKRKKEVGNNEQSNPNWKKHKNMTHKDIQNLSNDIMRYMGLKYNNRFNEKETNTYE